jgi:hypothetical protein
MAWTLNVHTLVQRNAPWRRRENSIVKSAVVPDRVPVVVVLVELTVRKLTERRKPQDAGVHEVVVLIINFRLLDFYIYFFNITFI